MSHAKVCGQMIIFAYWKYASGCSYPSFKNYYGTIMQG